MLGTHPATELHPYTLGLKILPESFLNLLCGFVSGLADSLNSCVKVLTLFFLILICVFMWARAFYLDGLGTGMHATACTRKSEDSPGCQDLPFT